MDEVEAVGPALREDRVEAPGGVLGDVVLGVIAVRRERDAGTEGGAVVAPHLEPARRRARQEEEAGGTAGEARVVGVADVDRRRPVGHVVEAAGSVVAAELRLARAVRERRQRGAGVDQADGAVVGVVGGEQRVVLAGAAAAERHALELQTLGRGQRGGGDRVARALHRLVEGDRADHAACAEGVSAVSGLVLQDLAERPGREAVAVLHDPHPAAAHGDERPRQRRAGRRDLPAARAGARAAREPAEPQRAHGRLVPVPRDVGRPRRVDGDSGLVPRADRDRRGRVSGGGQGKGDEQRGGGDGHARDGYGRSRRSPGLRWSTLAGWDPPRKAAPSGRAWRAARRAAAAARRCRAAPRRGGRARRGRARAARARARRRRRRRP